MSGGTGTSPADSTGLGGGAGQGVFGLLLNLLVAEKSGFNPADPEAAASLQEFAERMTREAMTSMPPADPVALEPATNGMPKE